MEENGLLERNGQHKWRRTNKTLEGVSNGSKYRGQERRNFCSSSVPALGRGADLVNFSSVSANSAILSFVHAHSKLANSSFSGTNYTSFKVIGFTLKKRHMRRVMFGDYGSSLLML